MGRCVLGVEYSAASNSVVAEDERPRSYEAQGRVQVLGVALFVGIYEDHVEGAFVVFDERGEEFVGVADPDLDLFGEAGTFEVVAGDSGVMLVYLEGDQGPLVGKGTGEVDGTVAPQSAYLQYALRPRDLREQLQQPSFVGRDVYLRQSGPPGVPQGCFEDLVRWGEQVLDVGVDLPQELSRFVCVHRAILHRFGSSNSTPTSVSPRLLTAGPASLRRPPESSRSNAVRSLFPPATSSMVPTRARTIP